jgi:HK97 family phage major capsid protein
MSKIQELADRLEALRSEINELEAIEGEPTEEQAARMEALLPTDKDTVGEWDQVETEYKRLVARAEKVEAVRSVALNPANIERSAPAVIIKRNESEILDSIRSMDDNDEPIRGRAMEFFEDKAATRGASDDELEALMGRIEGVKGAARHAILHGTEAYRSAFKEFLRSQGKNPMWTPEQSEAMRAAMSLTSNTGGYGLPTMLDPTLIHTGAITKNPLRRISRVETGTQNVWHGVSVGNVTVYRKGEGSAFTAGDPTFAGPSVTASMLTAYVTPSFELLEDYTSLAAQLPGLIGEAFDSKEGAEFVTGSGSTAPKGIVTALSGTAASTVTATTRGAFTTASAVDVFALVNALPDRYEDSSTWLANKQTFNTIKQMSTGSNGSYFWSDFNSGIGQPLLDSPVVKSSAMASAQTSGTKLIVLGDFSQYVIYDRIGIQVEFIDNVVDGSGLPTGQRGIIAYKRNGADVTDLDAFRIFNT